MSKRVYKTPIEVANAELPAGYEIEAVAGEHNTYMVLFNGFQIGGDIDSAGAGNATHIGINNAVKFVAAHKKGLV